MLKIFKKISSSVQAKPAGWWRVAAIFIIAIIIVGGIIYLIRRPESTQAAWFDSFWRYRQAISITNGGSTLTDYQLLITINTATLISAGKMSPDCSDVRLTDFNGNVLSHWIEENNPGCNNSATKIWVKVPSITTAGASIFIYYGNLTASSIANGENVFTFFDDFNGTSVNDGKWTVNRGSFSIVSGYLLAQPSSTGDNMEPDLSAKNQSSWTDYIVESRMYSVNQFGGDPYPFIGVRTNNTNPSTTTAWFAEWQTGGASGTIRPVINNVDDSWWQTWADTWTVGTWYKIKVIARGTNIDVYKDDVLKKTQDMSTKNVATGGISLGVHKSASAAQLYYDYVFTRQYTATEPVVTLSANEEKSPAPIAHWKFDEGQGMEVYNAMEQVDNGAGPTVALSLSEDNERLGANLINDGDFESVGDISNWNDGSATETQETSSPISGNGSLRFTDTTNGLISTYSNISVFATAKKYRIRYKVKLISTNDGTAILSHYRSNCGGSAGSFSSQGTLTVGQVKQVDEIFDSGLNSPSYLCFTIQYWSGSLTSYDIMYDDFEIREIKAGDAIGSNDGTIYGAAYTTDRSGVANAAMSFDGVDDYIRGGLSGISNTKRWSVSTWFKTSDTLGYVFDTRTSEQNGLGLYISGTTMHPYLVNGSTITKDYSYTITPADNVWHFLTVTRDGDNSISLYYDGVLLTPNSTPTNLDISSYSATWSNYTLGMRHSLDSTQLAGSISDFKVYDYARTAAQIKADYNSTKGSIVGATWADESECISGKCLDFDGTNDYVNIVDGDSFGSISAITISSWVKFKNFNNDYPGIVGTTPNNLTFHGQGPAYGANQSKVSFYSNGAIHGGGWCNVSTGVLDVNKWYQLTVINNGNTNYLYVDGNLVASTNCGVTENIGSLTSLYIGSTNPGVASGTLDGYIDEVKIYNYALTSDQVKAEYLAAQVGASKPVVAIAGSARIGEAVGGLSDGLVGYWSMDESNWSGISGEVVDSSGNGNNGTPQGSINTTNGRFGMAGDFNGSSQYITVGSDSSLDNNQYITVSAWIYYTGDGSEDVIFSNGTGETNGELLQTRSTTTFRIIHNYNGYYLIDSGDGSALANRWIHVVYTFNNNILTLYMDGKKITTDVSADASSRSVATGYIGRASWTAGRYFQGRVDDLKIYNRSLSDDEIMRVYKTGPKPVAYYDFENNGGSIVYDRSGNGNDGELKNMDPTTDWVAGKFGSALNFDGSNDYVNVPHSESLNLLKNMTLSAWVKTSGTNDYSGIIKKNQGNDGYQLVFGTSNKVRSDIWNGSSYTSRSSSGANIEDGAWHYITVTYDNTLYNMYIDGVLDESGSATGYVTRNLADLVIGNDSCCGSRYYNGLLDEIKIYNYARTAEQILQDMHGDDDAHPIAAWSMEKGYGSTLYDDSGHSRNSTAWANATWTNYGVKGKALDFNGSSSSITINKAFGEVAPTQVSVSIWAKRDRSNTTEYFFDSDGDETTLYFKSDNKVRCEYWNGSVVQYVDSNTTITDNIWHHYLCTIDYAKSIKLYIDGELDNSNNAPSGALGNGILTNSYLGARGVSSYFFDGQIDEVKLFNFILSPEQVKRQYNLGVGTVLGGAGTDSSGAATYKNIAELFPPGQIDSGLIGYWKMDENSWATVSGEVKDSSGNNKNGTAYNGTNTVAGKYDKAGYFDGSNDYITIGTVGGYSTNFTIAAWVNHSTGSSWDDIMNGPCGDILFGFAGTTLSFGGQCNSPISHVQYATAIDNAWHHVAASYDNATARLYVDGKQVNSASRTGAFTPGSLNFGGGNGTENFIGKMDEVRLYNRTLSSGEIAQLAERGPISYYNFEEGSGGTAYDLSGNNSNGAITNATYQYGHPGWALNFDGSNDYVTVTENGLWDFGSSDFTLSFWADLTSHLDTAGLVTKVNGSYWSGIGFSFTTPSSPDSPYFRVVGDSGAIELNTSLGDNYGWKYFTGMRKGNTFTIYIDGQYVTSTTSAIGSINNDADLFIGKGNSGSYNGKIDEVKIFDYALTPAQLAWQFNKGKPIAWWDFDDGQGNIATDKSGNGKNGTLANMTIINDDPTSGMLSHSGLTAFIAAGCVDNNTAISSPAWHTDSSVPGAYLKIDLGFGNDKAYTKARIYDYNGGNVANYSVQYSDDNSIWTTAATNFIPSSSGWNEKTWANVGAHRYWRLYLTNTPGGGSWLTELEMYSDYWTGGIFNNAIYFSGDVKYMEVASAPTFKSSVGSYSYWINLDSQGSTDGMFHLYENSTADYIRSYLSTGGDLDLYVEDDNVIKIGVSYNLNNLGSYADQWLHVAWVQDGIAVRLYINGEEKTLGGTNSGDWWSDHLIGNPAFKIGYAWAQFDGQIDDFRIYNYALSQEQIKSIMNYGSVYFK